MRDDHSFKACSVQVLDEDDAGTLQICWGGVVGCCPAQRVVGCDFSQAGRAIILLGVGSQLCSGCILHTQSHVGLQQSPHTALCRLLLDMAVCLIIMAE